MASPALVAPRYGALFEVAAAFTCLAGSHSSLMLAAASIQLRRPRLMGLTALQFSVQSIFSLHFIAMCGMQFAGVDWGFDVGLTLVSLAVVVLFGTPAITLALLLRHRLEPQIQECFAEEERRGRSVLASLRLLRFILGRVPPLRLLLAVVLMVGGAAGCHHVGMWSIHGLAGVHLMSELTYWSFLTTVALGGAVCVVAILAFLVVPEGPVGFAVALLLTGGIAVFHFCSATWGMRYVVGAEGVTTRLTVGSEAIIVFIVAQGALSQLITAVFSRMALEHHGAALRQLAVAQTLGRHIAAMDLEPAKQMKCEALDPTLLEQTLFHIVDNLVLYRPYLPDTLFQNTDSTLEVGEEGETASEPFPKMESGVMTCRSQGTTGNAFTSVSASMSSEIDLRDARGAARLTAALSPKPRGRRAAQNLAVGLRPHHLTVLRIRLTALEFGGARALNADGVGPALTAFTGLTTAHIKAHGGTIVQCAGGVVVAIWYAVSPEPAVEAALAIQAQCDLPLVQVVQSGPFLAGNLATDHLRAFNVVGPTDWAGQQLLRLGCSRQQILITSPEWARLRYKYRCLPVEQVVVDGSPVTVFQVLRTHTHPADAPATEWMYEVEDTLHSASLEAVTRCWQAYLAGQYAAVPALAGALGGVPGWYPAHLVALAADAAAAPVKAGPAKSLDALGWPPAATPDCPSLLQIRDA